MSYVLAVLDFLGMLFGWIKDRNAQNTPDVKEAQQRQDQTDRDDQIKKDVAKGDLDALREDISE